MKVINKRKWYKMKKNSAWYRRGKINDDEERLTGNIKEVKTVKMSANVDREISTEDLMKDIR